MARRSSRRPSHNSRQRDRSQIANRAVAAFDALAYIRAMRRRSYRPPAALVSPSIDDRRLFHPDNHWRQPLERSTRPSTLRISRTKRSWLPHFNNSNRVMICVRRKRRKEVILALGKGGSGGSRIRRKTPYSGVHC